MKALLGGVVLASFITVLGGPTWAAETPEGTLGATLAPAGSRVRITTVEGGRFAGRLVGVEGGQVTLLDDRGLAVRVGSDQLARVELSERRGALQGFFRGALVGAAVGATFGVSFYFVDRSEERPDGLCGNLETGLTTCTSSADIKGYAATGALIGGIVGVFKPGATWRPIQSRDLRVSLAPAPGGGVAVRASLGF